MVTLIGSVAAATPAIDILPRELADLLAACRNLDQLLVRANASDEQAAERLDELLTTDRRP